jgi:hypothetical protein
MKENRDKELLLSSKPLKCGLVSLAASKLGGIMLKLVAWANYKMASLL